MKTRVFLVLVATALSIFLHGYLTASYYPLKLGFASGESLCKVSDKFDCQAVSASSYSGFLGFPLSVWGLVTNAVLFLMVLLAWWRLTGNPQRLFRLSFCLATLSFLASLIMASISLINMSVYCLFCILLYALSLLAFEMLRETLEPGFFRDIRADGAALLGESKSLLLFFAAIPLLTFFVHNTMLSQYGADQLDRMVATSVSDWVGSTTYSFSTPPLLVFGPDAKNAALTIAEFADFRCSHCKNAAPTLDAFKKSHPDVRMEYYAFPLDADCNKEMNQGNGVSCALAKATLCGANRGIGWQLHERFFEKFETFVTIGNRDAALSEIQKIVEALGVTWPEFLTCVNSADTQEQIAQMVSTAVKVGVEGTPAIFANGKKLSRGQLLPVLEQVYREAKATLKTE